MALPYSNDRMNVPGAGGKSKRFRNGVRVLQAPAIIRTPRVRLWRRLLCRSELARDALLFSGAPKKSQKHREQARSYPGRWGEFKDPEWEVEGPERESFQASSCRTSSM
jgi:hypothetical protein